MIFWATCRVGMGRGSLGDTDTVRSQNGVALEIVSKRAAETMERKQSVRLRILPEKMYDYHGTPW